MFGHSIYGTSVYGSYVVAGVAISYTASGGTVTSGSASVAMIASKVGSGGCTTNGQASLARAYVYEPMAGYAGMWGSFGFGSIGFASGITRPDGQFGGSADVLASCSRTYVPVGGCYSGGSAVKSVVLSAPPFDQNTDRYFALFGQSLETANTELRRLEWLDNVLLCVTSGLPLHFQEQGLAYPDFPELTDAVKRDILVKAEEIHSKRGTIAGLSLYVGCFAPIGVSITINPASKKVMYLGMQTIGLPNADMLASVGDLDRPDDCYYLYDPQFGIIEVSILDTVSDEMKAFFETTLPDELPYAGTDVPSIQFSIVYT